MNPVDLTDVAISLGVLLPILVAVVIIIVIVCIRKKRSKTRPELIVPATEEGVVESDGEEEDDDYMISKAPVSAKLPSFLANKAKQVRYHVCPGVIAEELVTTGTVT